MNKKNDFFVKISNPIYIDVNSGYTVEQDELITYIGLCHHKKLIDNDIVETSINNICYDANYSFDRHKGSYLTKIKGHLQTFVDRGWIMVFAGSSLERVRNDSCIRLKLLKGFEPQKDYTMLTENEFDNIMEYDGNICKSIVLRVYLFIKSKMFYKSESSGFEKFSAYYMNGDAAINDLKISRERYDNCLNFLVNKGLLAKYETGSYYTKHNSIINAPNVYVLNDKDKIDNINEAVKRLKYKYLKSEYGNGNDFMPIVYTGKKIKKDQESKMKF